MQPSRAALFLSLVSVVSAVAGTAEAGDLSFQVDQSKVSEFQGKAFTLQDAPGFGGTAAGFDKAFRMGSSDWSDRRANLGGRGVYAPDVDMGKAFAVPQTSLFQGDQASAFSGKAAPLAMTDAKLPMTASMPNFGATVPFAGKSYEGPEADKLRAALDRLFEKNTSADAVGSADPLHPSKDDGLRRQLNKTGGTIAPVITVQDVKGLINKDVAPLPADAVPAAAAAPGSTAAAGPVRASR